MVYYTEEIQITVSKGKRLEEARRNPSKWSGMRTHRNM
jgi:hypothetical protein